MAALGKWTGGVCLGRVSYARASRSALRSSRSASSSVDQPMELAIVIVIVAAVLVGTWVLGSMLLRLAAWVLWISAAVGLAIEDGTGVGPALVALLGLLLWLG